MTLRVLLFGPIAATAGRGHADVDVPEGATPGDVLGALAEQHPSIATMVARSRLAVNHAFAPVDAVVRAGDEVALVGLVSGG